MTRFYNDPATLSDLRGAIQCEHPTVNLYEFKGTITTFAENDEGIHEMAPLGLDNILLRGARLKDTQYIYGTSLFTTSYLISMFYFRRLRCVYGERYEIGAQFTPNEQQIFNRRKAIPLYSLNYYF